MAKTMRWREPQVDDKPSRIVKDRAINKAFKRKLEKLGIETDALERRYCSGKSFVRDDYGEKVIGEDGKYLRKPCQNRPIIGGFVCRIHGGTAKQVRAAADRRLNELIDPAVAALGELIEQTGHLPTRLGAAVTVLKQQRVIKPDGGSGTTGAGSGTTRVVIGVNFGGLSTGKPTVAAALLPDGKAVEAEIVDDGDGTDHEE